MRGMNIDVMWRYLLALAHCLMFHNSFRLGISNARTLCPLSPSVERYRENYSLGRIPTYHSDE